MYDLAEPMDTGIGASGAVHPDLGPRNFRDGALETVLDRQHTLVGLRLPAIEASPVILEAAGDAGSRRQWFR